VRDLAIKVPRGRRDRYPEDPQAVDQLGQKYGIASSLERLVKALSSIPSLTKT